jgi:hypothetical protein
MPTFASPDFKIELPSKYTDATSYCFVLPVGNRFHPSVVIKFDALNPEASLDDYVAKQCKEMAKQLKAFSILRSPVSAVPAPASTSAPDQRKIWYEWGEGSGRFRQVQLFRRVGGRIYILTGTLLAADSVDYTAAVENVLASFQPSL